MMLLRAVLVEVMTVAVFFIIPGGVSGSEISVWTFVPKRRTDCFSGGGDGRMNGSCEKEFTGVNR